MSKLQHSSKNENDNFDLVSDQVAKLLKNIHFGSIEIIVHDGKVVQVEKHEKFRLITSEQIKSGQI